jgi:hypothetical protein
MTSIQSPKTSTNQINLPKENTETNNIKITNDLKTKDILFKSKFDQKIIKGIINSEIYLSKPFKEVVIFLDKKTIKTPKERKMIKGNKNILFLFNFTILNFSTNESKKANKTKKPTLLAEEKTAKIGNIEITKGKK